MPTPDVPTTDERTRAAAALELRRTGLPYHAIADRLGYADESGARKAVTRLLDRREAEGVAELRAVEGDRLDALQAAAWDAAVSGDLDAIKTVLSVIDRRCRLFGLNAPMPVAVAAAVGISDVTWAEQVAELLSKLETPEEVVEAFAVSGGTGQRIAAVVRDHRLDADGRSEAPEGYDTGSTFHRASGALSAGNARLRPEGWSNI
ncbi:hypothetical protein FOV72_03760 [Gordonia rubripertincta]|uniref:hypothetical protein n=1 Tax=Gordonia rubripertincta TaxID=36822 RepID=UPI00117F028F|nr:hypothetical protein [Gordonia rubripertincta]TSD98881.1 hypothetical protein FOV72_03760 [Gordonia rubripertincta]